MYSVEIRLKPTYNSALNTSIKTLQIKSVKKVPTKEMISFFNINPNKMVGINIKKAKNLVRNSNKDFL